MSSESEAEHCGWVEVSESQVGAGLLDRLPRDAECFCGATCMCTALRDHRGDKGHLIVGRAGGKGCGLFRRTKLKKGSVIAEFVGEFKDQSLVSSFSNYPQSAPGLVLDAGRND